MSNVTTTRRRWRADEGAEFSASSRSRRKRELAVCNSAMLQQESGMDETGIGWIAAIIIGGLAGWLAKQFMNTSTGVFMNIVLGIVGAALASALLGILGVSFAGWIGYLIAGFIGACILIALGRAIRPS
jgi:uncharacterized membrane protein YeaQ/YmgE (transglycosylase-associated protein family)